MPAPAARRLLLLAACLAASALVGAAAASAHVVRYRGVRLDVPANWPVVRLATNRGACVRFDRHALYLGTPSAAVRCPAHAAGRTEAILAEPSGGPSGAASSPAARAPLPLADVPGALGAAGALVRRERGVLITATWDRDPGAIGRALGVGSPRAIAAATAARSGGGAGRTWTAAAGGGAGLTGGGSGPVAGSPSATTVSTGLGFDACSAPAASQMSAWSASPYRALGVYIGGTNMACAQSNLTAQWVSRESTAGWRVAPIYVGLQAPRNSCGCAAISAGSASSEGAAAARDAVAHAQTLGLGAGNPIYVDMEGYDTTSSITSTVMTFLSAWTHQLHASGYVSGVYSSAASGITDLAARWGSSYTEPDDIWIANWNGRHSTADGAVASSEWADHQRLHQYSGDHNETYGHVTLDIDGDYLDGATAATGGVSTAVSATPLLSVRPAADGTTDLVPSWGGASGVVSWRILAGSSATTLAPVRSPLGIGSRMPVVIRSAYPYFAVQALGADGQTLGSSSPVAARPHVAEFSGTAFVPARGPAAVPVACYPSASCTASIVVRAGRSVLARVASAQVASGGGLLRFPLSGHERSVVRSSGRRGVAVTVTVASAGRTSAVRTVRLIPAAVTAPVAQASPGASGSVRLIGGSAFVLGANGTGGVLVGCLSAVSSCTARMTLTAAGGRVVSTAASESIGAGELGFLRFRLNALGRRLLAHARGDRLAARVTVTTAGPLTAAGALTLSAY